MILALGGALALYGGCIWCTAGAAALIVGNGKDGLPIIFGNPRATSGEKEPSGNTAATPTKNRSATERIQAQD
jgi:hypothetical protein